nr:PDZ domain-containing protein [Deltaproteobacteria bacterium]
VDIEPDNAEAHYLLGYYASEMEVEIEIGAQNKQPGLKVKDNGVIVSEVQSYSPADRAGMRVGDIIYKVGSLEIHNEEDYQRAVKASLDAGKVTLQLAESKGTETILRSVDVSVQNADEDFGLKITDNGVIVSKVQENSLAAQSILKSGRVFKLLMGVRLRIRQIINRR